MIPPGFTGELQNYGHMENKQNKKKLIWEDLYKGDGADKDGRETRQIGGDTNQNVLYI